MFVLRLPWVVYGIAFEVMSVDDADGCCCDDADIDEFCGWDFFAEAIARRAFHTLLPTATDTSIGQDDSVVPWSRQSFPAWFVSGEMMLVSFLSLL